jgi:hypothetical protein
MGKQLICRKTIAAALLVSFFAVVVHAESIPAQPKKFEDEAHSHVFYSEYREGSIPSIEYLVCNKTNSLSDFFWTIAGFGIDQDRLPANHCVQRTDFLNPQPDNKPAHSYIAAKVYVREETAEVRTLYWCEYLGVDRCDGSIIGAGATWTSTLRAFAEGSSNDFPIFLTVEAVLEGQRYQIEIRRSEDSGQLLVVAVTDTVDGIFLEPSDGVEAKTGLLKDFLPASGEALRSGLSDDMSTLAIFTPAATDMGARIFFDNRSLSPAKLAVLLVNDDGSIVRLDSPSLETSVQ